MRKSNKGITLIALIITIIVLLILAIVTINAVKDGGIINYAQRAKNDYERGADEENTTLGGYLSLIESNIPGGNNLITNEVPGESLEQPEEKPMPQVSEGTIAETNSTINGEIYSSTNPIIPAGFKAINTETSKWDEEGGPEVDNGLVITDGNSEFVWVPLTEGKTIEAYGLGTTDLREPDVVTKEYDSNSGSYVDGADKNPTYLGKVNAILKTNYQNSEDFKTALTTDFNEMAASVNKYSGFYVGRYEMSLTYDKMAQSKYGEESSDASKTDTETWYGLYARAKTYTNPEGKTSVKSSMIWGNQYDTMMNWMGEAANTAIDGYNTTRQTGTVETDKIKNVYDLYGNSYEWTLEAGYTYYRLGRGGYCINGNLPSFRVGDLPTYAYSRLGSRLTLCIM